MCTELKSRLARASAAIAVGVMALAGVASAASAQSCNTPYSNCGWTAGQRYSPPDFANGGHYNGSGYYPGYYAQQPYYPQPYPAPQPAYQPNPAAVLGQMFGQFVR